jgi:hypothetical protein
MSLESRFPKLLNKIDEEIDELRYLVVVDENYDDEDSDEFDIFDPEEYNYLVYITPRVSEALGEEKMEKLREKLETLGEFEEFLSAEEDLFGIKSDLSEEEIAHLVALKAEELV